MMGDGCVWCGCVCDARWGDGMGCIGDVVLGERVRGGRGMMWMMGRGGCLGGVCVYVLW